MKKRHFNSVFLDEPMEIVEIGTLEGNSLLTKVKIKIAYAGLNRNGSYIPKETFEQMAKDSLVGTPIIGHYLESEKDFGDHGITTEISEEEGTIKERRLTIPYGFIPEDAEVGWEAYRDEGDVVRDYLTTTGYLWTGRFPEVREVIERGLNNQSMEIDPYSVKGQWAIDPLTDEEVFIIEEGKFIGLCILGADVEPAFEGATVDVVYSLGTKDKFQENVSTLMEEIELALKYEFDDSRLPVSVVEVDNEEELESIKHAVDELDKAAEQEVNNESQRAIDSVIDTLLDVEKNLEVEKQVVGTTKESQEVLDELVDAPEDIVSEADYEKVKPITTPFEEDEEMPMNTEEEVKTVEEEVVEEVVKEEVEEEVPAERETADEKREKMNSNAEELSDEELLEEILGRVETAENVKERLKEIAQGLDQEEEEPAEDFVEEEKEEEEAMAEEQEDEMKDKEDYAELGGIKQERKEEGGPEATPAVPDGNTTPDVEKGQPTTSKPDVEEGSVPKGPKKKDIQTYELEIADLSKKLVDATRAFEALKASHDELKAFKLEIEKEEKEKMLSQFSLLDEESREAIRADFSKLSVEEVEAKCAVAYYRKGLVGTPGQNSQVEEDLVSYNLESETQAVPGWIKALERTKQ